MLMREHWRSPQVQAGTESYQQCTSLSFNSLNRKARKWRISWFATLRSPTVTTTGGLTGIRGNTNEFRQRLPVPRMRDALARPDIRGIRLADPQGPKHFLFCPPCEGQPGFFWALIT